MRSAQWGGSICASQNRCSPVVAAPSVGRVRRRISDCCICGADLGASSVSRARAVATFASDSLAYFATSNDGGANHQYDLHDFFDALAVGNMPAVSVLKAIVAGDGHDGYSDPLLEQSIMLVPTINAIMRSPFWKSTGWRPRTRSAGPR